MDASTLDHLNAWILKEYGEDRMDEGMEMRARIIRLVSDDPSLLDGFRSWPELRSMVERSSAIASRPADLGPSEARIKMYDEKYGRTR